MFACFETVIIQCLDLLRNNYFFRKFYFGFCLIRYISKARADKFSYKNTVKRETFRFKNSKIINQ